MRQQFFMNAVEREDYGMPRLVANPAPEYALAGHVPKTEDRRQRTPEEGVYAETLVVMEQHSAWVNAPSS
jgi:hypothetical protein